MASYWYHFRPKTIRQGTSCTLLDQFVAMLVLDSGTSYTIRHFIVPTMGFYIFFFSLNCRASPSVGRFGLAVWCWKFLILTYLYYCFHCVHCITIFFLISGNYLQFIYYNSRPIIIAFQMFPYSFNRYTFLPLLNFLNFKLNLYPITSFKIHLDPIIWNVTVWSNPITLTEVCVFGESNPLRMTSRYF